MNEAFSHASEQVESKDIFFTMNHILPYIKLTLLQGTEKECGSPVSNNRGKNNATLEGANYTEDLDTYGFTYPYPCYTTTLTP